jgi:UDP-N-acetylglucosamine--N-acetylmuramyl-(pentapeptide) pyrophosphoryl-undecaprenol N-acetylglucosamine transferase
VAAIRTIFAGGGTGGHLFPAIAIADELKRLVPDAEILFVGTKDKLEARVVPERGYRFQSIWISGMHRRLALGNLLLPVKVVVAMIQSIAILKEFRPDIVVGTGGYVSAPVLHAAVLRGIPTIIQEQNSYPGMTTRSLAHKVTEVHVTFEETLHHLRRTDNVHLTGNPTRSSLNNVNRTDARRFFGFDEQSNSPTLLVVGGSLGARSINRAVEANLDALIKRNVRVIWQTGTDDFERVRTYVQRYSSTALWIGPFIDRMEFAYAASDLVVCRAGATTLAELTRLGKPALLVPYPYAAADHQSANAQSMQSRGAAEVVYDHELPAKLVDTVVELLTPDRMERMSQASKTIGRPAAAREIAERIRLRARDS